MGCEEDLMRREVDGQYLLIEYLLIWWYVDRVGVWGLLSGCMNCVYRWVICCEEMTCFCPPLTMADDSPTSVS